MMRIGENVHTTRGIQHGGKQMWNCLSESGEKLQRKVGLTILSKPPPRLARLLRVCVQRCGHRRNQHHILSRQSPRPLRRQRLQPRLLQFPASQRHPLAHHQCPNCHRGYIPYILIIQTTKPSERTVCAKGCAWTRRGLRRSPRGLTVAASSEFGLRAKWCLPATRCRVLSSKGWSLPREMESDATRQ